MTAFPCRFLIKPNMEAAKGGIVRIVCDAPACKQKGADRFMKSLVCPDFVQGGKFRKPADFFVHYTA